MGCVTVAFMNVVGAQTLLSWNADVAQQAIKIFHNVVGEELKRRKGYLVRRRRAREVRGKSRTRTNGDQWVRR